MPLDQNPHQTVTRFGSVGFPMYACGFSVSQMWRFYFYIHTYIGHYNLSVRIIDLVSHTTYIVCVLILYISGQVYSLKSTPNGNFNLFSEFLPEICWEEIAEEKLFVFRFDVWPGARSLALHLISQHTTY